MLIDSSRNKKVINFIIFISLLFNSLGLSQTSDSQEYSKRAVNKFEALERILFEEYPNNAFPQLKTMTREQRSKHKQQILEQYKQLGLTHGYELYYRRHVHPSKWSALEKIDKFKHRVGFGTLKGTIIHSETIVIGRIKEKIYHTEKGNHFRTSIIVNVEEWLRDDFQLADKYEEVVLKYISGPGVVVDDAEPPIYKGEKLLIFLSRDGYVGELVFAERYHKDTWIPNVFYPMGADVKFVVDGSRVKLGYKQKLKLKEVRKGIRDIVKVLDVPHFFNYKQ